MEISFEDRRHIRAQNKGKYMNAKNARAKTIFEYSSKNSGKNAIPYTKSKIEINDNEQKQIRHEPSPAKIKKKEFNKEKNKDS